MPPEQDLTATPETPPATPAVVDAPVAAEEHNEEAMASMTAGYNKQKGITPETPAVETPAAEPVVAEATPPAEETPLPPAAPTVEQRLDDLQKNITAMDGTPESVRRIYGELGNIKRTLQDLQKTAVPGEPSPDLAAALAKVDEVAADFPEIAGPLAAAIKALIPQRPAASPTAPAPAAAPAVQTVDVSAEIARQRQQDAIELLADEHPDYETVRDTPEYKEWLASKPKEFQNRFTTTWNPGIVSKGLTEFKTWRTAAQAAKDAKQKRLAAAVQPAGEGTVGGPSKLPDSAGLNVGYEKVRRLNRAA